MKDNKYWENLKNAFPTNVEDIKSSWNTTVNSIQNEFDRFMHGVQNLVPAAYRNLHGHKLVPMTDIVDKKDHYLIESEVPGLSDKDINVTVQGNSLRIHGEKLASSDNTNHGYVTREISYGVIDRNLPLPTDCDLEKANAVCDNGVLRITIPKHAGSGKQVHTIKINKA